MQNILIAGALPYGNGSLHIGHISALLPGDILARYFRAKGSNVFYVSGTDCFGTPITLRARQENKSPEEISDFYHKEFDEVFKKLKFNFDLYTKTSSDGHKKFVEEFHKNLYKSEFIIEKSAPLAFCDVCQKPITDRMVKGLCPICGKATRGDQCDSCGEVLESENIIDPVCAECGNKIIFKETRQLYITLPKLKNKLLELLETHPKWRKNAIAFTKRYIDEGLRDRAITRDLDWGVDVPMEGYENKKIYIWAENVLAYLSATHALAKSTGTSFKEIWGDNSRHYYVHGKDNIPFHTIILPALLFSEGGNWHLPDYIISSEFMTLEGKKISTSQNWAIWLKDIIYKYNIDSIRYFFIVNGPEKRDTDFSWREFTERNNGELLGAYGNFVNRTLIFIKKYFNDKVPAGILEKEISLKIESLYEEAGSKIEEGHFKDAIDLTFEFIRFGNKYFDVKEPWKTRNSDIKECENTLYNCVQIISNTAVLLEPFLPLSSEKIFYWLGLTPHWKVQYVSEGHIIPEIQILFERLDKSIIDQELANLKGVGEQV